MATCSHGIDEGWTQAEKLYVTKPGPGEWSDGYASKCVGHRPNAHPLLPLGNLLGLVWVLRQGVFSGLPGMLVRLGGTVRFAKGKSRDTGDRETFRGDSDYRYDLRRASNSARGLHPRLLGRRFR